ncbi:MAG: hypothetical protein AAFW60_01630 [Pseudomonadota bacterium]
MELIFNIVLVVLGIAAIGAVIYLILWSSRPLEVFDGDEPKPKRPFLGLTKSDWANAGRWMQHHFASWFSGSFVLLCMFSVIMAGIALGAYFDGQYAQRWAPLALDSTEPTDADRFAFRALGWLNSFAMVVFSSAGVLALRKRAWLSGTIALLVSLYFFALSLSQSIGYVGLTAEQMTHAADSYDEQVAAREDVKASVIRELERQRDELNDLVAERTGQLSDEIGQFITDGELNDERADGSRDLRTEEQRRQDNELKEINRRLLCMNGDDTACTPAELAVRAVEAADMAPRRYDPVVEILSFVRNEGPATAAQKDALTVNYMFFWSMGAPILGAMLSVFLMITRHNPGPPKLKPSSPWKGWKQKTWGQRAQFWRQYPKDDAMVDVGGDVHSLAWLMKAIKHRKNWERGQMFKNTKLVGNDAWLKEQRLDIVSLFETGYKPVEIAEKRGLTLPELEEWVRKFFKPSMADKIMRVGEEPPVAEPEGDSNA